MSDIQSSLWQQLRAAGLAAGEAPPLTLASPWYVRVLLAFSGWMAAMFLFGFIGVGFVWIIESGSAALAVGGIMLGASYLILRAMRNEFLNHLGLAVSLAGQVLLVWGMVSLLGAEQAATWLLVALLQSVLAIVMPDFIHRVFSAFAAVIALAAWLIMLGAPQLLSGIILFVAAWLWLHEFAYPRHLSRIRPIAYGLVLALIALKSTLLLGAEFAHIGERTLATLSWVQPWLDEVIMALVALYVAWQLLARNGHTLTDRLGLLVLAGVALVCIASLEAQGITLAMVIMLLGFATGNRVLLGLGIAALLFYLSTYYYQLEATLLDKAQILLVLGVCLLVLYWLLHRFMPAAREDSHG